MHAQNGTGLSKQELGHAKKLYKQMFHSNTYIKLQKQNSTNAKKLNGIELPNKKYFENVKKIEDVKPYITDWLTKSIKMTKFKSVEEGVDMIMKSINLTDSLSKENSELYRLLEKANRSQFLEVMESESINHFDRLYELQNNN